MKRFATWILFMILLASASCTRLHPRAAGLTADPSLTAIDSLLWTQPDTAFTQLLAFAESPLIDSLNDFNGHYFHLLLSELLYKNDYAQTNRDELLRSVDYYDSLVAKGGSRVDDDLVFLDARSHYTDGVGYYEMDSVVKACEQYLKALEVMEDRFSEKELTGKKAQFMALAYTRLMDLYSDIYFHEQAVRFALNALDYYEKIHVSNRNIAFMLDELGANYEMMEQIDSAAYYYGRAFQVLSSDSASITYRDLASRYAFFSYKSGNSFDSTMAWFRRLLAEAENEEERNARVLSMGELFLLDGQEDSAFVWLERGYLGCDHLESKIQAAKWLKDLCDVTGHSDEKKEYDVFLSDKASTFDHQSELLSQLSDLYLSYSRHGAEMRRELTVRKTWTMLLVIVGLLLAVSAFVWCYVRHKHRAQSKRQEGVFSEQLEKGKREQEKLTRALKNKELERINLYSELERYKTELIRQASDIEQLSDAYKNFRSEAICQSITFAIRRCDIKTGFKVTTYEEKALNPSDYRKYLAAVNKHAGRFGEKLASCFPSLTKAETKMCYLLLLDLKDKELAVLQQISYQAVGKQMKSLLEKTGNTREGMVAYLISLAFAK